MIGKLIRPFLPSVWEDHRITTSSPNGLRASKAVMPLSAVRLLVEMGGTSRCPGFRKWSAKMSEKEFTRSILLITTPQCDCKQRCPDLPSERRSSRHQPGCRSYIQFKDVSPYPGTDSDDATSPPLASSVSVQVKARSQSATV